MNGLRTSPPASVPVLSSRSSTSSSTTVPCDGLAEKDATLIRYFRALLREHSVTSDLFAKMIAAYGKQRTVEMIELAGDYWTVGTMMNAGPISICRRRACR
jgi:hypothetical protein